MKSFILKRAEYTVTVPVTATTAKLYQAIKQQFSNEEIEYVANPSFYYPMGSIKQLDSPVKELHEYGIPEGAKLIMMAKSCFRWSTTNKPDNLEISNKGLTVRVLKPSSETFRGVGTATILGTVPMKSGKHLWTIKLNKIGKNEESLTVGVCYGDIDTSQIPMNTGAYWGYQPMMQVKFGPEGSTECGDTFR